MQMKRLVSGGRDARPHLRKITQKMIKKMTKTVLLWAALILVAAAGSGCAPLMAWAGTHPDDVAVPTVEGGDPVRGRAAVRAYGCETCHTIPHVASANAVAGPPLDNWAERLYIAGAVPNEPEYLIQWIINPKTIEPDTIMPNLKVTEQDARDISAFLYTIER